MSDANDSSPQTGRARILVMDADGGARRSLRRSLTRLGCDVREASSGSRAIHRLECDSLDVFFAGIRTPGPEGLEVVRRAKRLCPDLHVVLMTDGGAADSAEPSLQAGADDFLLKPVHPDQLRVILDKVFEKNGDGHPRPHLAHGDGPLPGLVGSSPVMEEVYRTVRRVAPSDETVLLAGESGTGKELAARAVHFWSRRRRKPFVCVNCAALTDTLVENELFGHEPQSFTGATGRTMGLVEQAHGGTLFLDEVGDARPILQTSLLRVLQEREFRRVGSTQAIPIDLRVIAATNKDLERLLGAGAFRQDLFYRLSVVPIRMPPLREHPEDIPLLIQHFLGLCEATDRSFEETALHALQRYPWPGNVRELHNLVRRLRVLVLDSVIRHAHLPARYGQTPDRNATAPGTFRQARETFERTYIEALLQRAGGNVAEAARRAGLGRPHLHEKLRHFGIRPDAFRDAAQSSLTA
jgi:DNA-binding NtrC family response regulator